MAKKSVSEFATAIKQKFPEYANLPDERAVRLHVDKFPGDAEFLAPLSEEQQIKFNTPVETELYAQEKPPEISPIQSFQTGAGQGATFNFGEELGLQDPRTIREASRQNPLAYTAGEIAGGLPYDVLTGGLAKLAKIPRYANLIQRLPGLKKLVSPLGLEATKGFVSGVGGGEEGSRLTSGLIGGTLSAAIPAGLEAMPASANRAANYLATRGMMPTASQLKKLRLKSSASSAGESEADLVQRLGAAAREFDLTSPFETGATRLQRVENETLGTGLLPEASEAKKRLISEIEQSGAKGLTPEEIKQRLSTIPERLGVTTPSGEIMKMRQSEVSPTLNKIMSTLEQYKQSRDVYGMKPPETSYQPPRMPVSGDIELGKTVENIPISLSEMDKLAKNAYAMAQLKPNKPAETARMAAKDIRTMVQEQASQVGRGADVADVNRQMRDLIQLKQLLQSQTEKEATLSPISFIPSTLGAGITMAQGGEPTDYARNVLLANLLLRGRGYRAGSNIAGGIARGTVAVSPFTEALARTARIENLTGPITRGMATGE